VPGSVPSGGRNSAGEFASGTMPVGAPGLLLASKFWVISVTTVELPPAATPPCAVAVPTPDSAFERLEMLSADAVAVALLSLCASASGERHRLVETASMGVINKRFLNLLENVILVLIVISFLLNLYLANQYTQIYGLYCTSGLYFYLKSIPAIITR